ncbi:hypothetical protein [Flavicella sp.]|uniref:hypothetical protein n=1 Tax=Flavicella sp. TaxID=2957742 RepID=UPI00301A7013
MNISYHNNSAVVESDQMVFSYEVSETPRDFANYKSGDESLDWVSKDYHIGDWRIHSYGDNNDLPKEIQKVVQSNSDAPGSFKRKTQLLWGKGPKLYKEKFENNQLIREWVDDEEVQTWLDKWDYEDYLVRCNVDNSHVEGAFTKFYRKAKRVPQGVRYYISKLEHSGIDRTRLASECDKELVKPTHAVVTDFSFEHLNALTDMKVYELFNFKNPFKSKTSLMYSNMFSFCADYYAVPDIYGSLEWLRRSNAVPMILKALSKHSINPTFHIVSPQAFWNQKEEDLKDNCEARGVVYSSKMLQDYESELLKGISRVLSSEKNTGKFWHSKKTLEIDGTNLLEHGWEIKKIDSSVRDFIKGQIDISDHSSKKIATSIGLHSAIGGSGETTKVNSGGEQHYAMENYLKTQNDIPEMIVCKPINMALKVNFPEKNLKIGFYHVEVKRLEDTTPSERPGNEK